MVEEHIITKINCWLQGEDKAFEVVYYHYQPRLYRYVFKYLRNRVQAEDITTEVLVRLWKKRRTIQPATFEHYLFTIARNLLITGWRRKIDSFLSLETAGDTTGAAGDDFYIAKELNEVYRQSLSNLPEQRRKIFLMHREESLSYKEIADKLDISPKTVENQVSATLKQLRTSLAQYLASVII